MEGLTDWQRRACKSLMGKDIGLGGHRRLSGTNGRLRGQWLVSGPRCGSVERRVGRAVMGGSANAEGRRKKTVTTRVVNNSRQEVHRAMQSVVMLAGWGARLFCLMGGGAGGRARGSERKGSNGAAMAAVTQVGSRAGGQEGVQCALRSSPGDKIWGGAPEGRAAGLTTRAAACSAGAASPAAAAAPAARWALGGAACGRGTAPWWPPLRWLGTARGMGNKGRVGAGARRSRGAGH